MRRLLLLLVFTCCSCALTAQAQQQPIFYVPSTTTVGGSEISADFNGDGKADIAWVTATTSTTATINVEFGQGTGAARTVSTELDGCQVDALYAADLNNDGHLDVVMPCEQGYAASMLGNGDGSFQAVQIIALPAPTRSFLVADFNGDGQADIATFVSTGYAVLMNAGGGKFAAAQSYAVSIPGANALVAADFNGDGKKDLFLAGARAQLAPGGQYIYVGGYYALGNGDGTFGSIQTLPFPPDSSVVGDFDEDGYDDIIVMKGLGGGTPPIPYSQLYLLKGGPSGLSSNPVAITDDVYLGGLLGAFKLGSSNHLSLVLNLGDESALQGAGGGIAVFAGHGNGSFSQPQMYAGYATTVLDVNSDGNLDMVLNAGANGGADVALGNSDGTFSGFPYTDLPSGTGRTSIVADMNGDGLPDVISPTSLSAPTLAAMAPQVSLSAGNGHFVIGPQNATIATGDFGPVLLAADVNGDGKQDVLSIVSGCSTNPCQGPKNDTILTYLGDGAGALKFPSQLDLGIHGSSGAVTGTFKNDGKQDVVVIFNDSSSGTSGARFVAGNGDGTFATPVPITLLGFKPTAIVASDLNGDGKLDLVIADGSGTITSYIGNGDGTFTPVNSILQVNAGSLNLADISGDGVPDLVCAAAEQNEFQVFQGKGDGSFTSSAIFSSGALPDSYNLPSKVAVGDLNGDGLPDIAVGVGGNLSVEGEAVDVWINQGGGTFARDPNVYVFDSQTSGTPQIILARANRNAPVPGQSAYLDAIALGPGITTLLNLHNPAPPAAPTLSLSLNGQVNLAVGQTITLYATLAATAENANPSGQISFTVNGVVVGSASIVQGEASVPFTIAAVGANLVQANYVGDANDAGSTATLTFQAQSGGSATTLTASASSATVGTAITFTATVAPSTATGTVEFYDGHDGLNQGTLTSGVATFTTSSLAVGTHSFTAVYSGDSNDAGSTSAAVTVTINPVLASPTLALSVNGSTNVVFGQTVTVNATLTPAAGNATPTGTVDFLVNSVKVATANLAQNLASVQITMGSVGTIAVQAVYSGDAKDNGATASLNLVAAPVVTSVTLTADATSATLGVPIALTATVAPSTATGTVSFSDGGTALGQGTLTAGVATYTASTLAVGSHSITAAYSGDADDAAATSTALAVSVTAATLQLTANPASLSIAQGGSGSTTITVTPVGAYAGTVTFSCSGLPANSKCTFTPTSLTFPASGNEAQTATLTITTNVATAATRSWPNMPGISAAGRVLALVMAPVLLFRRRSWKGAASWVAVLVAGASLLLLASCGGGGGGGGGSKTPTTPVGTSTVVVSTGAGGSSLNLTVTVTQ